MTRADGGVALEIDTPLTVEGVDLLLLEVGVDLNLVDSRLDAASSNKISELGHHAVAHTNGLAEASVDKGLHVLPDDVVGR